MAIFHIVLFKFKCLVPYEEVTAACDRMLGLRSQCVHPLTKKEYVEVLGGGRQNSPQGPQSGMTHCFVLRFDNAGDREYYLHKDPAHLQFVKDVTDIIEKTEMVDFMPGEF